MKWEINKGIIEKLYFKNRNIILPWGFETSDSYSFYSQYILGNRNKILKNIFTQNETKNIGNITVQMREGLWNLKIEENIDELKVRRKHELDFKEESFIFDMVQRYRFKKENFTHAIINNTKITHKNSNIYYQFKTHKAILVGQDFNIEISSLNFTGSHKFETQIYVRDFNDEWIIHVRLWPLMWEKEVIKLCVFWYNKAIPQFLSNIILKNRKIRNFLWIRGERKPFSRPLSFLSPCVFPEVKVPKHTRLIMESECKIIPHK